MKKKTSLDLIDVKSPCNESWDEMFGNDEVRFCSHCAKNVHNLSAMTRQKAEELIKSSSGKLCVRYVKNPKGKIVTAPPKLTKITRRAAIAASVLATSLTLSTMAYSQGEPIVKKDNSTQTQKDKSKKDETKQGFATVSGTATDEMGAVIPGVRISVKNLSTKAVFETISNDEGNYLLNIADAATYSITANSKSFNGFKELIIKKFKINKKQNVRKNLILKVNSTELMGVIVTADEIQTKPKKKKN